MFFVALKVKDRGVLSEVNMIASIEELQDLLSKVSMVIIVYISWLHVNVLCDFFNILIYVGARCCEANRTRPQ
jgi:hypothetical protein